MPHTLIYIHHAPLAAGAAAYGVSAIWRRAETLRGAFRRHGVAGVAMALAGRMPPALLRAEWYSIIETRPPGDPSVSRWPEVRRAAWDDIPALVAVGHAPVAEVRSRLERGDLGFVAFDHDEPVGYFWYRAGGWREEDIEFQLLDDERWGYDAFVRPTHRGRGVASALAVEALVELMELGVTRVISVIDHLNEASLRSAARYGGHPIGSILTVAVPWVGFVWERQAGEPRPTIRLYWRRRGIARRPPPAPAGG